MVVSTGAVRMSVPIVPAQTIKQVTPHSNRALFKISPELDSWILFPAGCTEAFDVSDGRHHQSDPATPHHACHSTTPDPAQLHQPPSRHRPGSGSRRRERGLRSRASTIRHTGQWCWGAFSFTALSFSCVFIYFLSCFLPSAAPAASVCDPLQQPQFPSIHWSPDSGQITTERVRRDMKAVFNYSLSFICSLKQTRHLH